MNLQQFLLVLLARRRIAGYTLLVTVITALAVSLLLPKQYTSSAFIVVDVKSPDPVAGLVMPGMMTPSYMATQLDIINSQRVARRVVKLTHMDENPAIRQQWIDDTEGRGQIDVWMAALLTRKLDVKPARESNVIEIAYTSKDPAFSAVIANAFAQAYIDTAIELKVEPARHYARWFHEQGAISRDALEKAQSRLSDYQQAKGIVANDERLDAETAKLNDLSAQLTQAQAQSVDASSKHKSAGDTLPEVMQNSLVLNLKFDIARLEAKQQELAGNLGRNHPQYQRTESELQSMKQRLEAETRQIASSISTSGRISKGKETELLGAIESQKKKLLDLKSERDKLAVLQREVDSANRAYEVVSQRATQSSLEGNSTQTNLSVLTPAVEPLDSSSPKILLNTLLALVLGTLLGVGAALIVEMLDRRVRSPEDLELTLGLPVLAELSPARQVATSWWIRLTRRLLSRGRLSLVVQTSPRP